jgi:dipeptidyl aminopeptidase/acylaminoacyl peptidase
VRRAGSAGGIQSLVVGCLSALASPVAVPSARANGNADSAASQPAPLKLLDETTAIDYQRAHEDEQIQAWRKRVPEVERVRIKSSADGKQQRALWYDSGSKRARPLLVVLHSWSADYEQNLGIPFARFAIENDWVFIHPDFRGPNLRPEATASDVAAQDIVDAVAFVRGRAAVDANRIYLVGYSGGAMTALVMAGRHPELWAGVVAWAPVYDVADWYHHSHGENRHYKGEIAASCGGVPKRNSKAEAECRDRSPAARLERAAGRVPILIAHGLADKTVPPSHTLRAFDALAAPQDRFADDQRRFIDAHGKLPPDLERRGAGPHPLFASAGLPVRFERRSEAVTLVLFEGEHDLAYNASVHWLNAQRRR